MAKHPHLARTGLVLALHISVLALPGNPNTCLPNATSSHFLSSDLLSLGCVHITLNTFIIFQGCTCHTNAFQPILQTRAPKGHSMLGSQQKRELCHLSSPSIFSRVPVRNTSHLAHRGESKWSWQKLKPQLVLMPKETVLKSMTLTCWTLERRNPKKT
jgi:hypothetical protein